MNRIWISQARLSYRGRSIQNIPQTIQNRSKVEKGQRLLLSIQQINDTQRQQDKEIENSGSTCA